MGLTQGSQNPEKVMLSNELTGMKGRPLQVSGEDTPGPGTSRGPRQQCLVCLQDSSVASGLLWQRHRVEWARNG